MPTEMKLPELGENIEGAGLKFEALFTTKDLGVA